MNEKQIQEIAEKISSSKNYRNIYHPTVLRVVVDTASRYPIKKVEEESKKKLHQICSIYTQISNFEKKSDLAEILNSHSSTKERFLILNDFYKFIFNEIGEVKTIIEPACGMNPLTYFFMNTKAIYKGFDIDLKLIDFEKHIISKLGLSQNIIIDGGDIFSPSFEKADVYFLFKLIPLLEQQKKGSTKEILQKIPSKFIVATFPTKSISSKQKGMEEFYSEFFEKILTELNLKFVKKSFENEIVYVLKRF